jgi:hypothetical protein
MSIDRQEPLRNLATLVARIQGMRGTARLAIRNTVRMGTLHLYFELGRLVHVEGSRSTIDDCLVDLAGWTDGQIRLDISVQTERHTVTPEQETFFQRTLLLMQQRGTVSVPSRPAARSQAGSPPAGTLSSPARPPLSGMRPPRLPVTSPAPRRPDPGEVIVDAPFSPGERERTPHSPYPSSRGYSGPLPQMPPLSPVSPPPIGAEVLLSSRQWEVLVDAARAMLEGVGHLFGQRQAQNILQHVLAERSDQSEPLGLLQVDRRGWLREVRPGEMLSQPVAEVSEAFVLLISDFERRCSALVGEEKARQLIARALHPYQDVLAEIGIVLNAN